MSGKFKETINKKENCEYLTESDDDVLLRRIDFNVPLNSVRPKVRFKYYRTITVDYVFLTDWMIVGKIIIKTSRYIIRSNNILNSKEYYILQVKIFSKVDAFIKKM